MEAGIRESGQAPQSDSQSSFGIKKIVDCKIGEDGRQMYKVKWEPTWEPAENLSSCQHLIDEFWSFINKAKGNEEHALHQRKRARLDFSGSNGQSNVINLDAEPDQHRMTEDNKAEVHRLIARTNATQPGNLMTPSEMLNYPQQNQLNNMMGMPRTPTHTVSHNFPPHSPHLQQNMRQQSPGMPPQSPNHMNNKIQNFQSPQHNFGSPGQQQQQNFGSPSQQNFGSPGQIGKFGAYGSKGGQVPVAKSEPEESFKTSSKVDSTSTSKLSNSSSLKYLENFTNPYVKVIIVCKICSKEASKFSRNWKSHYLTHVSNEEKPHKCSICSQGFVTHTSLRNHMVKKHPDQPICKDEGYVKEEYSNYY